MKIRKLNVGSGADYKDPEDGWINLDSRENVKLDIKHNLDDFPYPFKNNIFGEIYLSHVLEHVNDPIKVLRELSRISKKGGRIIIKVPHAYTYANVANIQHKANFMENSFMRERLVEYDLEQLELVKKKFLYPCNGWKRMIPFKRYLNIFLNGIYDDLYFEFRVNKSN